MHKYRSNMKKIFATALLTIFVTGSMTGCQTDAGGASEAGRLYLPTLPIAGDIQTTVTLSPGSDGSVSLTTSQTATGQPAADLQTSDSAAGSQATATSTTDSTNLEMVDFETNAGSYTGVRLTDILTSAEAASEESSVYFAGLDGMMACIALEDVDQTYLVFGANGWEAVSINCPPSLDVKELKNIVVVADNPADVKNSIKITDENGTQRTVSPGTLLLKTQTSELVYQGQSVKDEKKVSVFLTDTYAEIGGQKLYMNGNTIETATQ